MKSSVWAVIVICCTLAICLTFIATRPNSNISSPTSWDGGQTTSITTSQPSGGDRFIGEWVDITRQGISCEITASDEQYKYIVRQHDNRFEQSKTETAIGVYNDGTLALNWPLQSIHLNSDGNLVWECGMETDIYRRK